MSPADLKRRKIAVLGPRSVGKSSLVIKFVQGTFVESYFPTIESTFAKSVHFNGAEYDCEIIDTAGQDEYSILNSKHAIGIHGYVLVYSVTSRTSFDMIQIIYNKIVDFCGVTDIPCVIVGSKIDLASNRQVDAFEGKRLAEELKAGFVETSAKTNVHVGDVFERCLEEVQRRAPHNQAGGEPPARSCVIM